MASEAARIIDFQAYRRRRTKTRATVPPAASVTQTMVVWVPVLPMIAFTPMPWIGPFPA